MPQHCIQTTRLERLLAERLTVDELQELTAHLDLCTTCQERLDEMMAAEPEWKEAARLFGREAVGQASGLQRVMHGMRDLANLPRAQAVDEKMLLSILDPPARPGQLGSLNRYVITDVIGRGGMGIVLKAIDPALDRVVAMKVLAPHLATSAPARRRFAREAQAAAAVSHDHVVAIHAVEEANGLPFLVMQYVPGISLQERLDRTGPLELREILRIGMQTAAGLAAAHAQGLVHRDIKPANILLENGVERVHITDFGLARAVDDASLTQSGVLPGTPQYMAPEQARGETVDHRADLFSLGSVLYALCTGRPPFRASTTMGVLRRVSERTPRPILEINPDVPTWLVVVIERLHAKDPDERFQTASELSELLGRYLAHVEQPERVPLPSGPVWPRGWLFRGRRRALPWQGALSLAAIVTAGLALAIWTGAVPPQQQPAQNSRSDPPEGDAASAGRVPEPLASLRTSLPHSRGAVLSAGFAPGGELLATGSNDGAMRLWDPFSRKLKATLTAHSSAIWSVAFADNGQMLASGSGKWGSFAQPGEIHVWDAATLAKLFSLDGPQGIAFSVAFSPDSQIVAAGTSDNKVWLWNLLTQTGRGGLPGVIPEFEHGLAKWDPIIPAGPRQLVGHKAPVRSVAFSHDGETLASGSFDGTTRLWDVSTGRPKSTLPLSVLPSHAGKVNRLAFSPDDQILAVAEFGESPEFPELAGAPGRVTLWDLASGREFQVLRGHRGHVLSLAYSPDGSMLATGGGDWEAFGEVKLWDAMSGRELLDLHGHTEWVECVAFSPDGRTLVSSSGTDGTLGQVKLWEVAPGVAKRGQ
jgi:serine/threonine protein kinase/WD40 repeat protein